MKINRNILKWILAIAGILAATLVILTLAAPWLINLDPVREKISTEVSRIIGGEVKFQKIRLAFLPRFQVVITKGSLSIPGTIKGSIESVTVSPRIWPLLRGDIQIDALSVDQPAFDIRIQKKTEKKDEGRKKLTKALVQEKITQVVGGLTAIGKNLEVRVKNGRLNIILTNRVPIKIDDIHIRVHLPPDHINFDIRFSSDFSKKTVLNGGINLKDFKSSWQLDLPELRPRLLAEYLVPPRIMKVGESELDLSFKFSADHFSKISGEFQGSISKLTLQRRGDECVIKGKQLKGTFHIDGETTRISLSELTLASPQLGLSGTFFMSSKNRKVALEINAKDVDIPSTRQAALKLAGDLPVVKQIFDILKGGRLPAIDFTAKGRSMSALGQLEKMRIKGNLVKGEVSVPGVNINVEKVKGDVDISGGILNVTNIEAQYGGTQVRDGSLRLGLSGADAPFHLDIGLRADLSQLPGILKQVLKDEGLHSALNRIKNLKGRAEGRLILGEKLNAIGARVKVKKFNLSAGMDLLPYPLVLAGNDFSYAGTAVDVKNFHGRLKNSNVAFNSVHINWEKKPFVDVRGGKAAINLDEIYAWMKSIKGLDEKLKHLDALSGRVQFSVLTVKGPITTPLKLKFKLDGSVNNLTVETDLLPAPLNVASGHFQITPDLLSLVKFDTQLMDASARISATFNDYLKGLSSLEMGFDGKAGVRANKWILKQVHLPPELLIRPPLVVSAGHFSWNRGGKVTFAGDLSIHGDLNVSVDVLLEKSHINIHKFVIRDQDSRARFALNFREKEIGFSFKGNLQKSTIDKFLNDNQIFYGWLKGDLKLKYIKDSPRDSIFEGKLSAKDFVLLKQFNIPVRVNSISIDGKGDRFHLESDMTLLQNRHLRLNGDVNYSTQGVLFDFDLSSDGIVLDELAKLRGKNNKRKVDEKKEKFWNFPVEGVIKLKTDYLKYKQYTLRPFHADIALHPEKIRVSIRDTNLCGIFLPGTLTLSPREIQFNFKPLAQNQDVHSTLTCLADKTAEAEGRFSLSGEISAQGPGEKLLESLKGNFVLNAAEGRFKAGRSFRILKDILTLVNITEIYKGKLADTTKEGFGYNSIRAAVDIKNETITLQDGFMDGLVMDVALHGDVHLTERRLNFTALVAPLKTVDSIVRKIPLVGYLLGGSLVTVAVRIAGDIKSPRVTLIPPSAVGEGLLGIMKRTLQLPVKIVEPFTSEKKK